MTSILARWFAQTGWVLLLSMVLPIQTVLANEAVHGFVKDEYYLGLNGTPAEFLQIAANPMSVFRSEAAYDTFRAHLGGFYGEEISDADFRALFATPEGVKVDLIPCEGKIQTSGITDSGRVSRKERDCYPNEKLIQVLIRDVWMTVASQGCYNPVHGNTPPPIQALDEQPSHQYDWVQVCDTVTYQTRSPEMTFNSPTLAIPNACGGILYFQPGQTVTTQRSQTGIATTMSNCRMEFKEIDE